ncbi:MAG: DUF2079 domain-containing protein [Chloroflexia bacterium]|nr:DUF2079 domain-containing protein [Chloroflexia bacterium]
MNAANALRNAWFRFWPWLDRHSVRLLVLLLLLFVLVFSLAAVRKVQLFRVGFDVALIHQAVWNTTQGRFLETHAYDFTDNLLGTDSFFMAAWLAPFYALVPSVYTLLVLQMVIVALGAVPLYLLARERLGPALGLLTAGLYLAYLPVQYGSLYEIRFRMMAMTWLCFLLYFVEKRRYWAALPFLFLALSCRLDTVVAVAMVGLYALLRRRRWALGLTLILAAVGWYLAMNHWILPHYSTRSGYMFADHYLPLGNSPAEILHTALRDPLLVLQVMFTPRKLGYLFQLGLPLLFLPLLHLPSLICLLPLLLLNLLSNRTIQTDIYHHYQGLLVPFLLVGLIHSWAWLARWGPREEGGTGRRKPRPPKGRFWFRLSLQDRRRAIGLALLLLSVLSNLFYYNPLPPLLLDRPPARTRMALALIERIPPGSPVAASNLLAPHVPVRRDIFLLPGGDFHYAYKPEERADYILLDLQSERGAEEAALLAQLLAGPDWRVEARQDDYVLLARAR